MGNDIRREALARQLAERMRRNPDEPVQLPSGEVLSLWKVVARTMDSIPAPVRTLLDAQGRSKGKTLRQRVASWFRRLRPSNGWIDPRDRLPPIADDGVLSETVLVKLVDKVEPAALLYGTPVGSHRWIFNKNRPTEYYRHVLDIDGWREMDK